MNFSISYYAKTAKNAEVLNCIFLVNSFFEVLSFFLRYRLPFGYISALGVGGDWLRQSPKINSTSKKELTIYDATFASVSRSYIP
jgi:hypothetical protein